MTLPNLITIARLFAVPLLVVWLLEGHAQAAFLVFVAAGVSDAIDGILARRFGMGSRLGAYLDPLADKALLVSIYVTLTVIEVLPLWLTALVVSRDVLIVGGVLLAWMMERPVEIRPLFVSKANTLGQIVLAATALAELAFSIGLEPAVMILAWAVAGLTIASAGAYVLDWVRHMAD